MNRGSHPVAPAGPAPRTPNPPKGFHIGSSYTPDLWPEARWETDAKLMKALGFNLVRMGEFAWGRMEPKEGQFDFGWLQRAVELFHEHGIRVCLCTPTAAAPRWLTHLYQETRWVDVNSQPSPADSRKHTCYANPTFRHFAHRITEQLAMTFANSEAVVAWQIDNEFGAHGSARCYCHTCEQKFREWLHQKYVDIENLNASWGTYFWSRQYSGWEEISLPRPCMGGQAPSNKAHALDHARFAAAQVRAFLADQVRVVGWFFPNTPVSTNWMPVHECGLDYPGMAREVDFTAWDNYAGHYADACFGHDFTRGMKGGASPIWILEQKCSPPDSGRANELLPDGEVTVKSIQNIACGADGIAYFTWRQFLYGHENAHGALLSPAGSGTRVLAELQQNLGRLKQIGEAVAGSQVRAPIAMVIDMDSWWALSGSFPQRLKRRTQLLNYIQVARDLHRAATDNNVDIDMVPPDADLSRYRVVLLPCLYVCTHDMTDRLKSFVANGGWLLATAQTAVADHNGNLLENFSPYGLHDVFGAYVPEFDCPPEHNPAAQEFQKGSPMSGIYPAKVCCDLLKPSTAEVWAVYQSRFYKGTAAVTANKYGQGVAIYLGALSSAEMYAHLLMHCCKLLHVPYLAELPDDVQVRRRYAGDTEFMFIMNHSDRQAVVPADPAYTNLITGEPVAEGLTVDAHDFVVLRR